MTNAGEDSALSAAANSAAANNEAMNLNSSCFCFTLNQAALASALETEIGQPGLYQLLRDRNPYVFAAQPVFVAATQQRRMAGVVRAIESVVALPAYQEAALARAPALARRRGAGGGGVFLGYDFHLQGDSLGLIEINTNAGGAMLNAVLARAQRACCAEIAEALPAPERVEAFERAIVAMFRQEWARAGRDTPLRRIAIVDEAPEGQYLYPEFLLFQQLFQRHGIEAAIADPRALQWQGGRLTHEGHAIDLVYNRLTDFYLEAPELATLRAAFEQDAVVLTPHPHAHALYADKRNLVLLSSAARLQTLGVPADVQNTLLENIPHTQVVRMEDADDLWRRRRQLFFKPAAGYGSRAAYRGDKLTSRVWQDILAGDYIAQAIVAPGERHIEQEGERRELKFDLRNYVYDGHVQWLAARLYQGQTTNFRTPGGGFAPVYLSAGPNADPVCHA